MPAPIVFRKPPPGEQTPANQVGAGSSSDKESTEKIEYSAFLPQNYSFSEAVWTRAFWLLTFSYRLRGAIWSAVSVYFVAILVWNGVNTGGSFVPGCRHA